MVKIICVKFKGNTKPYYFAPPKEACSVGDGVIVETAKGLEYATVTEGVKEIDESEIVPPLMPALRKATASDMEQMKKNREMKPAAMITAKEKIEARGLNMRLVDCDFSFDGGKVIFYFTADARVDFRELIRDLSSAFHKRIELRQINIREEISLLGGYGPCGRECCCMRAFSEFSKVTVKMAKNQGLSLNPDKISGLCGRLMCCLAYENNYYSEASKNVPKIGSTAESVDGVGTVVNVNMLSMTAKLRIEKGEAITFKEYPVDKIRFKRGNVVMGCVDLEEKKESVGFAESDEKQDEVAEETTQGGEKRGGAGKNFNRNKKRKNGEGHGKGQDSGKKNFANHPEGKQPNAENKAAAGGERKEGQNGKKHFRHGKRPEKPKNNS